MRIIDSGNLNNITYRFHCVSCDCVYEVTERELQPASKNTFPSYKYTRCPMCDDKIPTCYAEIVNSVDTHTETITESETKSESTENYCETCTYLGVGTRDDSSKYCMIPGKTPSTVPCDRYKSIETYKAERVERTKLREAAQFIQKYCANKHNCKGCPFDGSEGGGCRLIQEPRFWHTDFKKLEDTNK